MRFVSGFARASDRIHKTCKRNGGKMAVFPSKNSNACLDYSVDFSRVMRAGERLVSGRIMVWGEGLFINGFYVQGSFLTAFISGGVSSGSFYLVFSAWTDWGNRVEQELLLPTYGKGHEAPSAGLQYLALAPEVKPTGTQPPLNAIRIDGRYLLDGNGFFVGF